MPPTRHAVAVVVGETGVLVRGRSGDGKTALGLALVDRWRGAGRFAALVADDRVVLEAVNGRLIARAPERLAGLVERRGRGIGAVPHVPAAVVGLVVDLVPGGALPRMPEEADLTVTLEGVALPRQPAPRRDLVRALALADAALAAIGPMLPPGHDGRGPFFAHAACARLPRRLFLRRRPVW